MESSRSRTSGAPDIDCDKHHTVLRVSDIRAAVDFYTTKLGFSNSFMAGDPEPDFAGVNLGDVQIFLEKGTPEPRGCSVYFVVSNADTFHDFHKARGVEITDAPEDRPYELRD